MVVLSCFVMCGCVYVLVLLCVGVLVKSVLVFTVFCILCTMFCIVRTVSFIVCTVLCIVFTVFFIVSTVLCIVCTVFLYCLYFVL